MARMIPPYISGKDSPPGEVEIFDLLRTDDLAENWIVLHSLDIAHHVRQVQGEADFVVIVPGGAVVCLEVKSHHSVSRDDKGLWRMGNDPPEARGPFKQASQAMHSIREQFRSSELLKSVPFVSAVIFSRCQFEVESPEWDSWQVIDERKIRNQGICQAISGSVKSARRKYAHSRNNWWFDESKKEPDSRQCDLIVKKLRPAFEQHISPRQRLEAQQKEMGKYTEEQFASLDLIQANDRIIFSGAAGTGKTYLAIEAARRGALAKRNVLFVCFNNLLGEWLKRELPSAEGKITTNTVHSFMRQVAGIQVPKVPASDFWTKELPEAAIECLMNGSTFVESFDQIVVDEAQDICTESSLDFLELCLKGSLKGGKFLFFGDFERQRIFSGDDGLKLLEKRSSVVKAELSVNCRNRPRVGAIAGLMSGFGHPYKTFLRPDDGIEATLKMYGSEEEQVKNVASQIDSCREQGYQLENIVILSTSGHDPIARRLPTRFSNLISEGGAFPVSGKIRSNTVHAFKGLESVVVILTDVSGLTDSYRRQLLYIGASRSTEKLIINFHESTSNEIGEILTKGSQHGKR